MNTITLAIPLTDQQYATLCHTNRDLRFERASSGELVIMSPVTSRTGHRNGYLTQQLFNWSDTNGLGIAFDSSAGFKLPNGADRSPDAAWIRRERWEALSEEEQDSFAPICPDFIVELRSKSDSLPVLQAKMQEYLSQGVQLGWLIDPKARLVELYRPGQGVEVLQEPAVLSGETILPGFILDLRPIW